MTPPAEPDPRWDHLVDFVVALASGRLDTRLEPSPAADAVDAVIVGLNMLAEELQALYTDLEGRVAERTTQLEDTRLQLQRLALHDPLTGLANRSLLNDRINLAMAQADRGAPAPGVLVLDLDGFKTVNDSYGHPVGDLLLIEVAHRLQAVARETDTVARVGGDEFAMVISAEPQQVREVADRVLLALQQPVEVAGHTCWVSSSVGVRLATQGDSASVLLRDADTAMFAAKAQGRGRVETFEPAMNAAARHRAQLTSQLRNGLTEGDVVVHYQPVVDLQTERLVGVEALARWQHPEHGLIAAGEFIDLAQDGGLGFALGHRVREVAAAQLAVWRTQVLDRQPFELHLNIAPVELRTAGFAEQVLACLHRHGVAGADVVLDVTATAPLTLDAQAATAIAALRHTGIRVALDDFGTGHSALALLRGSLVDVIKIDPMVVADVDTDPHQHKVAAAVLGIVDAYGLHAVGKGIQTRGQATRLRDLGCRYGQGWLWGHAVDATTLTPLLATRRPLRLTPPPGGTPTPT